MTRDEVPELGPPVSIGVGRAVAHGVSQKVLRHSTLQRPFWGVRSSESPSDPTQLAQMYLPRLRPGQLVSEASAARLHRLPLLSETSRAMHVLVPEGAYRPSSRGVTSRAIDRGRIRSSVVAGVPVADPVLTWLLLARVLDVPALVTIGDALVAIASSSPGIVGQRPSSTLDALDAAVQGWRGMGGVGRLRLAQPLVRERVESPMETPTRLVLLEHGLPEPEVDGDVWHAGAFVARPDPVDRDACVAIEHDGDGHRTDRAQWQADVDRDERLHAAGWRVIHVTHSTLSAPAPLIATVRALLHAQI